MKQIAAIIVFFSLMVLSLFLGYANYVTAKEHIIEDVNRALVKTVLSSHPERITADTLRCQFYNERKEEIYFTSMQRSFMKMLMESEDKKVSIDDICRNLWPGKENAKESLYTLVRRLKPIVESNTNLKIVADKGGYYRLSFKNT